MMPKVNLSPYSLQCTYTTLVLNRKYKAVFSFHILFLTWKLCLGWGGQLQEYLNLINMYSHTQDKGMYNLISTCIFCFFINQIGTKLWVMDKCEIFLFPLHSS